MSSMSSADQRLEQLQQWLYQSGLTEYRIAPASGDASFRRYFRITTDAETYIAMDAPPEKEDCKPFITVAQALLQLGLNVPKILEADLDQGFLLLTDLGTRQYLPELNDTTAAQLYGDALGALLRLQAGPTPAVELPPYDHAMLWREMALFSDWFLQHHLGIALQDGQKDKLHAEFEILAQAALAQPQVWVHRDYHSRNLMITDEHNPGVLDFQDAVVGAITYDLVSLLRDCYVAWPREQVEGWVEAYRQQAAEAGLIDGIDRAEFLRWFDLMGVQRHLKAIGIFARLNHRDGKSGYLKDIPRTLGYVTEVSGRYSELGALNKLIHEIVLPRFNLENGMPQ